MLEKKDSMTNILKYFIVGKPLGIKGYFKLDIIGGV